MQQELHPEFNQPDLGHGATGTILHPAVIAVFVIASLLLLWRPRKSVAVPFILCLFLIPGGQVLVVNGVHVYVRAMLVLIGFIRVVTGKFKLAGGFNEIDKIFILWASYRAFSSIVTNWPDATMEQIDFLLVALCGYFLWRYLIADVSDLDRITKTYAVVVAILGIFMAFEYNTLINLFGTVLGGAPVTPMIREGSPRAQATFGHAILAGCFGATLIPLFVGLWIRKSRMMALLGLSGAALMVYCAKSSTPVLAAAAGIMGLMLWPIRGKMRFIRWGIVALIIFLSMVMKAPVWFAIAHVEIIGHGGWDRAQLIDICIRHFSEWWLIGTNQNSGWGYDMWDLSNQFVAEAETGGLLTFICFIAIITRCFSRLGTMRKRSEVHDQWLFWCLGASMLAHNFAYFGVSYWDQSQLWWFSFLAMISAVTAPLNNPATASEPTTAIEPAITKFGKPAPISSSPIRANWPLYGSLRSRNSAK